MFTKQDILRSGVLVWIIVSAVYIGWDTWRDYQIRGIQQAYQAGVSDTTKLLFEKSQAGQCKEPFSVSFGESKMELIDVKCLQQPAQQVEAQVAPSGAAAKK